MIVARHWASAKLRIDRGGIGGDRLRNSGAERKTPTNAGEAGGGGFLQRVLPGADSHASETEKFVPLEDQEQQNVDTNNEETYPLEVHLLVRSVY